MHISGRKPEDHTSFTRAADPKSVLLGYTTMLGTQLPSLPNTHPTTTRDQEVANIVIVRLNQAMVPTD
jgi:hypothetical protein